MLNLFGAIGLLVVAYAVSLRSPWLGGLVAMFPIKAIAYLVVTNASIEGVRGMLTGTLLITVPFLLIAYFIVKG